MFKTSFRLLGGLVFLAAACGALDEEGPAPLVQPTRPSISGVKLTGDPLAGGTLTAVPLGWKAGPGAQEAYRFAWFADQAAIDGQSAASLSSEHFAKGQSIHAEVTPFDGTRDGQAVASGAVLILNTPPQLSAATLLSIGSPAYGAGATFYVDGWSGLEDADPADADSLSLRYQWKINGTILPGETARTLPALRALKGETVSVDVIAFDGDDEGDVVTAGPATVVNTPPTLDGVTFGTNPVYTDTPLTAIAFGLNDIDSDTRMSKFRWFVDGALLSTSTSIPGGYPRGVTLMVAAIPYDFTDHGEAVFSPIVTVQNSLPVVETLSIDPLTAFETSTLSIAALTAGDADGDDLTFHKLWLVNDASTGITAATLTGVHFDRGDTVSLQVTPHDGVAYGAPVTSNAILIQNTPPTQPGIDFQPAAWVPGDDIYVLVITASTDADPADSIAYTYQWFKNDVDQEFPLAQTSVSTALLAEGDEWKVAVTAADGAGGSAMAFHQKMLPFAPIVATAIATGGEHTCALTSKGGVKCWGNNGSGRIGDGTTAYDTLGSMHAWKATDVVGLTSGVTAIAAGVEQTCALTTLGGVKCWGMTRYDPGVGDLYATIHPSPIDIEGLTSGVSAVAAGGFTCALTSVGGVKCWGWPIDEYAEIYQWTPEDVQGLASGVAAITVGGRHACALTETAGVKCWGGGQALGEGQWSSSFSMVPVDIAGLESGVTAVTAGGNHTCVLMSAGGAKCWGANNQAQLGDLTVTYRSAPTDVTDLGTGITALTAGDEHTCALTTEGGVKCWGSDYWGQLGDGRGVYTLRSPVDVLGLASGTADVAAGTYHTCALMSSGGVKCWGRNYSGEIGDGTLDARRPEPVNVAGLSSGVAVISAGDDHTCAVTGEGGAKCWGLNSSGQLGYWAPAGNYEQVTPVDVFDLPLGVAGIAAASRHSCALTDGGGVKCWGSNGTGQLGVTGPYESYQPLDVTGLTSGVAAITSGANHTCALMGADGTVKCWGANGSGQLGDESTMVRYEPVNVFGLSGVAAISAGRIHTCALLSSGAVKCWGSNYVGQIGDGPSGIDRLTPVDVLGLASGVTAVAAGGYTTCALLDGGDVMCWGSNEYGTVGDGTFEMRPAPVDVVGLPGGVTALSGGGGQMCALTSEGGVKCWGNNWWGQIGDGTLMPENSPGLYGNRATPVDVVGLTSGIKSLSAGWKHTCALTTDGGAKCWGNYAHGQLGDGYDTYSPKNVVGFVH